ncbi:MAG: AEC family transporter [Kiritimatiellae bacterium]|nr:AEC family transporter [Kiritimatiellia bacterium]
MENLLEVAQQVAVLFVMMGVGAALRRLRMLDDAAVGGMVNLLMFVVTPCVIVDCFQRPFDGAMLGGLGIAFAIASLGHLALIAIAALCVRCRGEDTRRTLMLAAVFSNAGFMGLPLEEAVLGSRGVFFGAVYVAVFNLFIWSWGVKVMGKGRREKEEGRRKGSGGGEMRKMALNPGTVGIALGLPLFLLSVRLPTVVAVPVHHLSNLNTPLAMVAIGYSLAGARLGRVARTGGVWVAAAIRLFVSPLVLVAMMFPFRRSLDADMMLAMVIAASAPVAAMTSIFAAKFRRDVDAGVAIVSGTTLASIATMPFVIAFAKFVL